VATWTLFCVIRTESTGVYTKKIWCLMGENWEKMNLHITLTCSHGRMCILIYIILAHQGHFTIEQPSTSLLFRHPRFQQIISLVKESWFQIATYFGYHQKKCWILM
jgi:hypothetical protein